MLSRLHHERALLQGKDKMRPPWYYRQERRLQCVASRLTAGRSTLAGRALIVCALASVWSERGPRVRVVILLSILGLAALYPACGGDGAPYEEQDATEGPKETVAVPSPTSVSEGEAIGRLTVLLREANATHYAVGCAYRYEFAEGGRSAEDVIEGLSVRSDSNTSWTLGEMASVGDSFRIVTVFDMNSQATGATSFWRVDGEGRFCLVPKLPGSGPGAPRERTD